DGSGVLSWSNTPAITLPNTQILVGNAANVATAVSMSGEATIANTGAVTLNTSAVTGKVLTGFAVGANTGILATDSILDAFGKVQGQVNATNTTLSTAIQKDGSIAFTSNES